MHLESLRSVGLASFGLVFLAMILMEVAIPLFPFYRGDAASRVKHGASNAGLAFLNALLSRLAFAWIWFMACDYASQQKAGLANWLELPPLAHALFVIALLDAWTYWWHRLNHMIPFLWRFHRVHHSDPTMDVTTALRFHPGEILLSSLIRIPVLVAVGARAEELLLFEILLMAVEQIHHANIRTNPMIDALLRGVIASPIMHKIHHSNLRASSDGNYSGVLSVWDRIFGSLHLTPRQEDVRFGIMDFSQPQELTLPALLVMPWFSKKGRRRRLLDGKSYFAGDAKEYAKYKPSYPPKITQLLKKSHELTSESVVADVGSGTGLASKLFLKFGCRVYGIEPDDAMREVGEELLADYDRFTSVKGDSTNTTLSNGSVDFIVAAQAFQWFDKAFAKPEFKRILKPDGRCVLLWNQHPFRGSALAKEYDHLLHRYVPEFAATTLKTSVDGLIGDFFDRDFVHESIKNYHTMNFESFLGWTRTYAFNLRPEDEAYNPLMQALRQLYEKYNDNGHVTFEYFTHIFIGRFSDVVESRQEHVD